MKIGNIQSTPPAKRPTILEIAWAAGFIEGEGSFSGRRKSHRTESLNVSQVQKEPLDRLRDLFGGTVFYRNYYGRSPNHRNYYQWQLSGTRARGVMMTIFSFMSPRRRLQIKNALGVS